MCIRDRYGGEKDTSYLIDLVKNGQISEVRIDESVKRILLNKFEFFLEAMGKQGLLRLERGAIPPPCLRMSSIPPRSIKLMDSSIH